MLKELAHFEGSSEEISRFFTLKYGRNFQLIKQLQNERRFTETPLLQAKRALRTIQIETENHSIRRTTSSRQSERTWKPNATTHTFLSLRPQSNQDTFVNTLNVNTMLDIKAAQVFLQNLAWIHHCLETKEDVPNFQLYWESVCDFKQEQYIPIFHRPATQHCIQESIILNDIAIAYIQCQMKENFLANKHEGEHDLAALAKFVLEGSALFLRKLMTFHKFRNHLLEGLQQKVDKLLCCHISSNNFAKDAWKCNSFIKAVLEKQLVRNNPHIQPVIITCRYALQHVRTLDVQGNRSQLINSIFLSTQPQGVQVEHQSPLKSLFKVPQQHAYMSNLRESYSNLDLVNPPFLMSDPERPYTLILDLDETLGHFSETLGRFVARPHLIEFLKLMHSHFEIVLFTAGLQNYADHTIQQLGISEYIDHRLYRQHTSFHENHYVKDLVKVGRELARTVIVDNSESNFSLQPENGLLIQTWTDQPEDTQLKELGQLLARIAKSGTSDIRKSLRRYRDFLCRLLK